MSSKEHICSQSDRGCKREDCDTKCKELYCSIECACYDGIFSVTRGWLLSGVPPEEDITEYKYIDVPRYHKGKETIESKLEICPLCHDTKTVSTPLQTIKLIPDPEYRTECHKCKVWWHTYKTEFRS